MALDATGTPTSPDSIPKYNTAADPPSGKGFNAAMDAVQVALTARTTVLATKVDKPAGIADDETVVWDTGSSTWIRSSDTSVRINNGGTELPKVTIGTMASGPPGSPADGDIWVATTVDANGTRWMFQYNAGSASAHKWEFVGGPEARSEVDTGQAANSNGAWIDLATVGPGITLARAGDYWIFGNAHLTCGAGADVMYIGLCIGAAAATLAAPSTLAAGNHAQSLVRKLMTFTAGQEARLRYFGGNQVNTWTARKITAVPIRVS